MDRRLANTGRFAIALSTSLLLIGCGDSGDGEFRSYSELESQEPAAANGETRADSSDVSAAAPNDRQGPPATEALTNATLGAPGTAAAPDDAGNRVAAGADSPVPSAVESTDDDSGDDAAPVSVVEQDAAAMIPRQPHEIPVEAPRPEPREITLLVPHREFRVEGPEGAIRVSYDDIDLLKVLNMEPVPANCVDYFPDWLRNLDGQRIRIRGFMYPPFETTGIRGFVLARDNQICCFGRFPKRYDVIDVFMRRGVTTDYIQNRPFDVVGTFHIQPEDDDGELYQLYVIDDAIVIE
jgi:hypothetical protein